MMVSTRQHARPVLICSVVAAILTLLYLARETSVTLSPFRNPERSELDQTGVPIITLASTRYRYEPGRDELSITLESLLKQSGRVSEIRIYLPSKEEGIMRGIVSRRNDRSKLAKMLAHPSVKLHFVEDIGPSCKFMYIVRELLEAGDLDRPVVVVDDDHKYSRSLISGLMKYSLHGDYANASLGFRGWRVHSDYHWRVVHGNGTKHALKAWELSEPLHVSVLSASEGYLIKPRFFGQDVKAAQRNLLDVDTMMATSAHLVDDIWMMGNLARNGIQRFIVPLQDGTKSRNVASKSRLDKTLSQADVPRTLANDATLLMFKEYWLKENLWQDKEGAWWKHALAGRRPR